MKTRNSSLAVIILTSMTLTACGSSNDSSDDSETLPVIQDTETDPEVDPDTDPGVDLPDPVENPDTDPVVDLPEPVEDPDTDPGVDLPDPVENPDTDPVVDLPEPVENPDSDPVVDLPEPVENPTIDSVTDLPDSMVDLPEGALQLAERMQESATEPDLSFSQILVLGSDQAWKCDQSEDDRLLSELTSTIVFETRTEVNPDRGTGAFLLDSDPIRLPTTIDWDFSNDVLTIVDTSSLETLEQWFNISIINTDSFTAVSFGGLDVNCFVFDVEQP